MDNDKLRNDLIALNSVRAESQVAADFRQRITAGKFTIQEDPESHFCVFFAAYDAMAKKFFIGHHKKADLWLFNGGHIDMGETMAEALAREIGEEWGLEAGSFDIKAPGLLTVTEIDNPTKQTCKRHYDIWYFIDVAQDDFKPDQARVREEFFEAGWKSYDEARELATNKTILAGIEFIAEEYFLRG